MIPIETFVIPCGCAGVFKDENIPQTIKYKIDKVNEKLFEVWADGSCIGSAMSINSARTICHTHARQAINRLIRQQETALEINKKIKEQLGDDVFNLGQFKK